MRVRVIRKNEHGDVVDVYDYLLKDYTDKLSAQAQRLVSDIEQALSEACGGIPKEQWPENVKQSFEKTRHKALDVAGRIRRQPEGMYDERAKDESLPEIIANMLSK